MENNDRKFMYDNIRNRLEDKNEEIMSHVEERTDESTYLAAQRVFDRVMENLSEENQNSIRAWIDEKMKMAAYEKEAAYALGFKDGCKL